MNIPKRRAVGGALYMFSVEYLSLNVSSDTSLNALLSESVVRVVIKLPFGAYIDNHELCTVLKCTKKKRSQIMFYST